MLTRLIVVIILQYIQILNHVIYLVNQYNAICQLYLNLDSFRYLAKYNIVKFKNKIKLKKIKFYLELLLQPHYLSS